MPYRRKYHRRPQKVNLNTASHALATAQLALRLVRALKKLLNVEYKKLDTNNTGAAVSTTATMSNMTLIGQGDGEQSRDGNSIRIKSILWRSSGQIHASATSTNIRQIMFRWNDDTAPTAADILEASTSPLSALNKDTSGKYHVIMDSLHNLNSQKVGYSFKKYKKVNFHNKYDGATGNDGQTGQVYLLQISDEATNTPTVARYVRVSFVDN